VYKNEARYEQRYEGTSVTCAQVHYTYKIN
jgi:hypothetical protein